MSNIMGERLKNEVRWNVKSSDDTISLIEEMFKIVGKAFKIPESLMLGNITNMNDVVKSF